MKQNTCHCEAYSFPHRLDGGKCRELYNETVEKNERELRYYQQRGAYNSYQRAMLDSGHSERDFG